MILFVAPIPPPVTGQSVACAALLDRLGLRSVVVLVNLSKNGLAHGVGSWSRMASVFGSLFRVARYSMVSQVIYFNASESVLGNLRDLLVYVLCSLRLGRVVVHLHGGAGFRALVGPGHPVLFRLNMLFLSRVGAFIVLGGRLADVVRGVVPDSRVHVVPNFAGDSFFVSQLAVDVKYSSVKLFKVLFLSNLLAGKGHDELLTSLGLLPHELRSRVHVDFAGGFESVAAERSFRSRVDAAGLAGITVHGVVQGELKQRLLREAHLFCLPTYYPYEGQPISILEAYASGCAVMTTDHSGIFDVFTPGVNGLEVKPRDPASIAAAIEHALAHPEQLKQFALNNLEEANQKFRVTTHLAALEKVIAAVGAEHA